MEVVSGRRPAGWVHFVKTVRRGENRVLFCCRAAVLIWEVSWTSGFRFHAVDFSEGPPPSWPPSGCGRRPLISSLRARRSSSGAPTLITTRFAKLASNENNFGPPESVMKAMNGAWKYANRYGYPDGNVVQVIAEHHGVKPENILLTAGSGEVLSVVGTTFLQGGKKVVGADPTYATVFQHASNIKAEGIKVPLLKDYRQDIADDDRQARTRTPRRSACSTCATRTTRRASDRVGGRGQAGDGGHPEGRCRSSSTRPITTSWTTRPTRRRFRTSSKAVP